MLGYITPEDWTAKELAAKNELAIAYGEGRIDVPDPVDENLRYLANRVVTAVIRAVYADDVHRFVTTVTN
jgi:hypothetical protein